MLCLDTVTLVTVCSEVGRRWRVNGRVVRLRLLIKIFASSHLRPAQLIINFHPTGGIPILTHCHINNMSAVTLQPHLALIGILKIRVTSALTANPMNSLHDLTRSTVWTIRGDAGIDMARLAPSCRVKHQYNRTIFIFRQFAAIETVLS